jgi:hypothetical protein
MAPLVYIAMRQIKTLREQIEQQTGRELTQLSDSNDDVIDIQFFHKKFGTGNFETGKILVTENAFDLKYISSKPYNRTVVKQASTHEDGVEVLLDILANETDMEVKDVQRQIENII